MTYIKRLLHCNEYTDWKENYAERYRMYLKSVRRKPTFAQNWMKPALDHMKFKIEEYENAFARRPDSKDKALRSSSERLGDEIKKHKEQARHTRTVDA